MLQVIVLGLFITLTLVSGECDVGTQGVKFVNFSKVGMCSVNKVMRLIHYNSVLTFKLQIEFVPFKIVPLGG